MSCSEGRRPSRIPRPTPVESFIDAGRNIGLSPHSPLAWGSKIPRRVGTLDAGSTLNESFTIPERQSRTLSPRVRAPPAGAVHTPVMRTLPPRFTVDERARRPPGNASSPRRRSANESSAMPKQRPATMPPRIPDWAGCPSQPERHPGRAPRKAASSPRRQATMNKGRQRPATMPPRIPEWGGCPAQNEDGSPCGRPRDERQDANRRLDMSDACDEDIGPDDMDLNTTFDSYHTAGDLSDMSCDEDEFDLADDFDDEPVLRGPSGRRLWQKPPQEECRITAGCLPTWGQHIVDMADQPEDSPEEPKEDRKAKRSVAPKEQSSCLDRQERTGIQCSLQDEGAVGGVGCGAPEEEEEDMWAAWEDPGVYHIGPAPGESFDDYERRHQALIDSFLYPLPTLKPNMKGCLINPKLGESPMNFLRRCRQAEAEYAAHAPPGEYTLGKRPEESWDDYEQRHLDLIDRFRFPQPRLKPNMPGCRINPEPGETPLEFIRRNRVAEEEYALTAPPEAYIYGRKPGETWDDYDRRSNQLIEKHWQATQRSKLPPLGGCGQQQPCARLPEHIPVPTTSQELMNRPSPRPPPVQRSPPKNRPPPDDSMRRRAMSNNQKRRSANEEFFGIGDDDACSEPSTSQRASSYQSPSLPPINEGYSPPPSPVRRPSPPRSGPSRAGPSQPRPGHSRAGPSQPRPGPSRAGPSRAGPSRAGPSQPRPGRSGVSNCVPSNVAAVIHGYGDI